MKSAPGPNTWWQRPVLVRGLAACWVLFASFLLDGMPRSALAQDQPAVGRDSQIGQSFPVPYRRTLTNHYLVRVRINGKGPFNFLVDTGAPALFVGTAVARKIGLEPSKDDFWTPVERFEIEGGIDLKGLKARVEDPFQLEGMNALGLPGATIDGILGFTVLARFKMEFDPRSDRMTWTRLDYEPRDPYVPRDPADRQAPAEVQAMNLLGPAMKLAAVFLGKQQPDTLLPQGLLGLIIEAPDAQTVRVANVWPQSAAEQAGIHPGDRLVSLDGKPVTSLSSAHEAITGLKPDETLAVAVERGGETLNLTLKASAGF